MDITTTVLRMHRLNRISQRRKGQKKIDQENARLGKRLEDVKKGRGRPVSANTYVNKWRSTSSRGNETVNSRFTDESSHFDDGIDDNLTKKVNDASRLLATITGEITGLLKRY